MYQASDIDETEQLAVRRGKVALRCGEGALPRCMLPYSAEKRTQAMEQGLLKPAGSTKLEGTALPFTGR